MEVLRRGTSRMDAARGVKGHGRPLYADPRSGDGANEPGAKRRAGWRGKRFWLLLPRLAKVTRPAGRNECFSRHKQPIGHSKAINSGLPFPCQSGVSRPQP